jgi:hypothetical protein
MLTPRLAASGLIAAALTLSTFGSLGSGSPGFEPTAADTKPLEAWWADLEKGEMAATRAVLSLADRPQDSVAFLATKLKRLTISSGQVKALLLKLGNDNEAVWRPAFEELDYFDPRLAIDLQTLMDRYTEYPVRQRLVEVLSGYEADFLKERTELTLRPVRDGFNFTGKSARGVGSWWAEHRIERINSGDARRDIKKKWTRAVRAIVLLERLHTPDAVTILKAMAGGHPDAYPTKAARQALADLGEASAQTNDPMPKKRR